jgi:plasmid maintenance system antidote protein VapI
MSALKQRQAGVRLEEWLRAERRSQEWLAEQLGTHQTSVSRWLLGRARPAVEMAVKIEKLTGIDVEDWTVEAEESGVLPAVDSATGTG